MHIPHQHRRASYLTFATLIGLTFTALANSHIATPKVSINRKSVQAAGAQGTSLQLRIYKGTLVFEDQDDKQWDGPAELEVKRDRKFTLKDKSGNKHDGELVTVVDSQGIPGGHIKFNGDRRISIKWTQDQMNPLRMKIVNVKADCIKFRFCSDQVSPDECRTTLKKGP